jgi:hypothetical protein
MSLLTALQENPTKESHLQDHRDITEILIFTVMTVCAVSHNFHLKNRRYTSSKIAVSSYSIQLYNISVFIFFNQLWTPAALQQLST